jgi:hypothetical protein
MKNNIENTMDQYSTQMQVAPRLVSTITGIVEGIQNFIARAKQEQAKAKLHMGRKNQMKRQLHIDTINQISLRQKLRMGIYRF